MHQETWFKMPFSCHPSTPQHCHKIKWFSHHLSKVSLSCTDSLVTLPSWVFKSTYYNIWRTSMRHSCWFIIYTRTFCGSQNFCVTARNANHISIICPCIRNLQRIFSVLRCKKKNKNYLGHTFFPIQVIPSRWKLHFLSSTKSWTVIKM